MKQFLEFVIRQLVEFPDEMMLSEIPSGKTTIFRVQLRQTDVGRIIGRNGQTIQAIRALLASSRRSSAVTSPLTLPLMTMCGAWISPTTWA